MNFTLEASLHFLPLSMASELLALPCTYIEVEQIRVWFLILCPPDLQMLLVHVQDHRFISFSLHFQLCFSDFSSPLLSFTFYKICSKITIVFLRFIIEFSVFFLFLWKVGRQMFFFCIQMLFTLIQFDSLNLAHPLSSPICFLLPPR